MATSREFLTTPLRRKFGSMPSLAQKSMISLDYKEGFTPRGVSDPPKTGTRQGGKHESLELPQVKWSLVIPAKNDHRLKIAWRSPLLEQQNAGMDQQTAGGTATPNKEKTAASSPAKQQLNEYATFLANQHSEWLSRALPFNERLNGVKKADTSLKTRAQTTTQGNVPNTGQYAKLKSVQARKQIRRKNEVAKLTTNIDGGKSSRVYSVEREFYFQDYRQKCIQWLKSLPDSVTHPMDLR